MRYPRRLLPVLGDMMRLSLPDHLIPRPDSPRFIPAGSPEPAAYVRVVTIVWLDPAMLRWERTRRAGSWLSAGRLVHYRGLVAWGGFSQGVDGEQLDLQDATGWEQFPYQVNRPSSGPLRPPLPGCW